MPKYIRCGHYVNDEICPCMECVSLSCRGCLELTEDSPFAVDTDKLCDAARRYCERGRTGADGEIYAAPKGSPCTIFDQ